MFKYCFNHFLLSQLIYLNSIEMPLSCNCCACLSKSCIFSEDFSKYEKCVYLKKSCSSSDSSLINNSLWLIHAQQKIEAEKKTVQFCQYKLLKKLISLSAKNLQLKHQSKFLKKYESKLICVTN